MDDPLPPLPPDLVPSPPAEFSLLPLGATPPPTTDVLSDFPMSNPGPAEMPRHREPMESDDQLLALAHADDWNAVTQLWNRYYVHAWLAARSAGSKNPDGTVSSTFTRQMRRAGATSPNASTFLADWFGQIGSVPPPPDAIMPVIWAFYAMGYQDRVIIWHHNIDGWDSARLGVEVNPTPGQALPDIGHANAQFDALLAKAAALLDVQPPNPAVPDWRADALTRAFPDIASQEDEATGQIGAHGVIDPPPPPEYSWARIVAGVPERVRETSQLMPVWWSNLGLPIRVAAICLVAVGVLAGGVGAWAALSGDSEPGAGGTPIASFTATHVSELPTMVPKRTPTPTPTPTPHPTPTPTPTPAAPPPPAPPAPADDEDDWWDDQDWDDPAGQVNPPLPNPPAPEPPPAPPAPPVATTTAPTAEPTTELTLPGTQGPPTEPVTDPPVTQEPEGSTELPSEVGSTSPAETPI